MRNRRDQGFALVELLVVIVIIGVLAAVAVPILVNQRQKAADASVKADLTTVMKLQAAARVEGGAFQIARTMNAGGVTYRTSPRTIVSVVSVSATDYCLVGSSAGSGADGTGLGSYIGWNHKMYYATVATGVVEATAAAPGCIAGLASTSNGWWDRAGYHDGSITLPS